QLLTRTPLHFFSLHRSSDHPPLHSFPTRRSSDLADDGLPHAATLAVGSHGERAHPAFGPGAVRDVERDDMPRLVAPQHRAGAGVDRKSTRLNSSHVKISYAVFCLKKKKKKMKIPK